MTKHLRLIMLSLLAMICMGGYAQNKGPEVTLDFSDYVNNPWKLSKNSYCKKTETHTYGTYTIILTPGSSGFMLRKSQDGKGMLQMGKSGASITLPAFNFDVEKIVVVVPSSGDGNGRVNLNVYVDKVAVSTETTGCKENKSYEIQKDYQKSGNIYVIKVTNGFLAHMTKIQIYKKGIATTTTFGDGYDGKTFNFVDGKLEGWNAPTATQTLAGADGKFSYESDNQDVATVAENGQLTFKGYGTAKITATFTPNDTEKYAKSTASYTVINKEGVRTPTTITFGSKVDNNTFEVKDGDTFEGKAATVTPVDATGSIEYKSSDDAIAKVDAKTGVITLGAKYGTAVITAQFVATGSFANSEASYSIKHVGDFVFYESFDNFTETQGGNDGNFAQGGGTVKSELLDEEGWILKSQYAANKCIRLGAKSTEGSATTRTINVPTSKATLSFKAAAWNNTDDMTTITVSVSDGSLTYDNKTNKSMTINMRKDAWTDYSMIVSGTKSFTVTFAGSDTKNRFFLDEVMVTKVAPQEITLDENSDNIVEAAENVNVTLKRTFYKDGEWNTLCLPFAVADAKTAFDNAELREVDTQNSHDNTIVFKEATAIEAGKPYLIKWANSSSAAVNVEKKFEGVTLVAAATPVVVKEGGISFNGFYKMTAASELGGASVAAIGAGNKLFKVTEGKMKGFRAAFVLSSGAEATKYNVVIDGTATGIEDLVIDGVKANGRVYNLNGQYVGNSLNGLQPGLYIQNGKKIVIK